MIAQATVGAKAPARIKTLLVKELADDWKDLQAFVVVCPIGLDAVVSNQLRAALESKNIKMTVVKNSVARVALTQLNLAPAAQLFDAPSAICYGGESVVDVARELVDWAKKADAFQVRGAFLEGQVFSAEQVYKLAAMPNRSELLSQISGLITSPAGRIASTLTVLGGRIAGAIKALTEKLAQQAPTSEEPAQIEKEEQQDSQTKEVPKPESDAPDEQVQSQKDEGDHTDTPNGK